MIAKPNEVPGNTLPDYEEGYDGSWLKAPHIEVWWVEGQWRVIVGGWMGRFPLSRSRGFLTPEEVVTDVLDFYFGDPSRMEEWWRRPTPEEVNAGYEAALATDLSADACRVEGCGERRVRLTAFCPRHFRQMMAGEL
jgi:hypothetical protein